MNLIEASHLTLDLKTKIRNKSWDKNKYIFTIADHGFFDQDFERYKIIVSCYNDLMEDWEKYSGDIKPYRKVGFLEACKIARNGSNIVRETLTAKIDDMVFLEDLTDEDIEANDWMVLEEVVKE